MCLAIPGKIISIDNQIDDIFRIAKVSFDGIVKDVNLAMVPEAKIGDYVLVHVGSAISVVDEEEARTTMDILYQMDEITELSYGNQPPENAEEFLKNNKDQEEQAD
jgi:hydrogenase expression/formation protein HypC